MCLDNWDKSRSTWTTAEFFFDWGGDSPPRPPSRRHCSSPFPMPGTHCVCVPTFLFLHRIFYMMVISLFLSCAAYSASHKFRHPRKTRFSAVGFKLLNKTFCVCVRARAYTMCEERTLCMFYTCKVRTFNQERTHSRSAVGFNLRFGLVILENPGIDYKIMEVAWVRFWYRNYFSNHFIYE